METKEPKGHDDKGRFLKGNRGNQFLFHLLQNPNLPRLRTIIRSYVRKENLNDARGEGKVVHIAFEGENLAKVTSAERGDLYFFRLLLPFTRNEIDPFCELQIRERERNVTPN